MAVEVRTDIDIIQSLNENQKVVVKFFADWCSNCKMVSRKFNRLSNDERFTGVTFLDVNAEKNRQSRKLAGVTNLPFFATFKNGDLIGSIAATKEDAIVELIEKLK